ncbi:Orotate phosphoribosyltransferase [Elusimicrobium minutum Pei191]|uniref:Orotate phosphoribosyltransferase n=1 Tax=Elusimicrobium minutum (strain Pei191) TaxID=445932 RepID=B2KEE7_ELUMP|nr:phosphoribosyltransferase family protein [Elusimicrobium minutum]ACC98893.1 Orotate phosphoribosyltransferase [Elusimicrobium minutum Pei191]
MGRTKNLDILSILEEHGAFEVGHFALPSGCHSQIYIHACSIMSRPHIAQKVAQAMSDKFAKETDIVLSPSPETSVIAQEVARVRDNVRAMFAEKCEKGRLVLKRNFIIKPGERVLIVDDVAVSGKKIERAVALVKKHGGKVIGVSVIVDRSSGILSVKAPLRALVSYPLKTYIKDDCPLCKNKIPLKTKEEK